MTWKEIETIFNRALKFTFSKRKLFFTIPILIFCGLISVFFRTLGTTDSDWLMIGMTFTPLFLCTSILLAAGIFLTRIYHHEVKGLEISYRRTLGLSKHLMVDVAYLIFPVILIYLVLWTFLGFFYLFKKIPGIGEALGVVFSFGPFLLLLGLFALSLLSLGILFFMTPLVSLKSSIQFEVLKGVIKRISFSPFTNFALMFLGLLPLIFIAGLMTLAVLMTGKNFVATEHPIAVSLEWFFMMIPFSTLLTPGVIFFFNFAAESHVLMSKKMNDIEKSECESLS